MEIALQPAPQATGQAKPAGSMGATPITPPPTPPTSSDHGSQETLPIQNTNDGAEECGNREATAQQTAEQDTCGNDERRRSGQLLSRATTAVESIILGTSQLKAQSSISISKTEDGVRVLTCILALNRAVIFVIVHFAIVFIVTFISFFLQVWSSFNQPPTISLDQMQQLLQSSTSDGSKSVLEAFEHHVGDENVNWNSLIQVLKACLNYSVSAKTAFKVQWN
jgi:hypothetical protein